MKGRADDAGPSEHWIDSSPLVDSILALLEEAGAPTTLNDTVVKMIEEWERSRGPDPIECPSCLGYGYLTDDGVPTNDRGCRQCLDCTGTGNIAKAGNVLFPDPKGGAS